MLGSIASSKASFLTPAAASGSRAGAPAGAPRSGMAEGLPAPQDCRRNNIDSRRGLWRALSNLPLVDPAPPLGSLTSNPAPRSSWGSHSGTVADEKKEPSIPTPLQECYFTVSTPSLVTPLAFVFCCIHFAVPLLRHSLTDNRSRSPDSNWAAPFTL